MSRGSKTRTLLELVKFEHSVFALPYAFIGALYGSVVAAYGTTWRDRLAEVVAGWRGAHLAIAYPAPCGSEWVRVSEVVPGAETVLRIHPTWTAMLWITVAMVGARSFAFAVNRAVDKEIDARNPRTAERAVPAGRIRARELWLFAAAALAAFLFAVWQLHPITRWLWPIAIAVFVTYPYTKRFTATCHYWLGLALGLAPVAGWIAVGGPIAHPGPWVLGLAVALWTAGFDIIYATQDVECDVRDGIHSMPADLGVPRALAQARVLHALTVALLVLGGLLVGADWPWYAGVGVTGALLWYENSIVRPDDLSRVNAAFFTVNGVIAVLLLTGAVIDRVIA